MSDNETNQTVGDYADLLQTFDEESLEKEKIEEINRMLAANVELFRARNSDPVDNQEVANWTAAAQWATDNANAVLREIKRRADLEEATAAGDGPTPADMAEMLKQARLNGMQEWLERAGELTDMGRTLMSMSLHLASQLPTEAAYDGRTWSYPRIQDKAQDAEAALIKARKKALQATRYIEMAIRATNGLMDIISWEAQEQPPSVDDIPF